MFKNLNKKNKANKGFTLIEILIVIGIIAILAAIVIIAINPAKQFAQARNTQRTANVNAILNAIGQRIADNKGTFAGSFTIASTPYTCPTITNDGVDNASGGLGLNLSCLVPTYIPTLPTDPKGFTAPDTGYDISIDTAGRVTVCAPESQSPVVSGVGESAIPNAPAICVTR